MGAVIEERNEKTEETQSLPLLDSITFEKTKVKNSDPNSIPSIDDIKNDKALIFMLDRDDIIRYADDGFLQFLGKPGEDVIGHSIREFLHHYLLGNLQKQEMTLTEYVEAYVKGRVEIDFLPVQHGERKTLHCEFRKNTGFFAPDCELMVIARHADTFRKIEKLLEIIHEMSQTLLDGNFDMIIQLDAATKIISLNPPCEKQLGMKKADLVGREIYSLIARERDRETVRQAFIQASDFRNVYNLKLDIKAETRTIPVLVNVTALRDNFNNDNGYTLVLHNIEDETRMGSVLKRIEAIDKMNALGELAVGISHQTKNYINSISTGLLLLENDISEGFSHSANYSNGALSHLREVKNSLAKLTWLTRHLLNFANNQKAPLDSLGNVNDVLTTLKNLVFDMVRKRKAEITLELSDRIPLLCFSPLHLEQALLNIVNNAIDALPPENGEIVIRSYVSDDSQWVCIMIADNGCGIPEDFRSRLFEIFETTKPVGKGTGLGLYMAKQVVSILKGTIDVESSVGEGTTFTVRLPIPERKAKAIIRQDTDKE